MRDTWMVRMCETIRYAVGFEHRSIAAMQSLGRGYDLTALEQLFTTALRIMRHQHSGRDGRILMNTEYIHGTSYHVTRV